MNGVLSLEIIRNLYGDAVMGGLAVVGALALAGVPVLSQTPAYRASRTADGQPNLNGIWQALNSSSQDARPDHSSIQSRTGMGAGFLETSCTLVNGRWICGGPDVEPVD